MCKNIEGDPAKPGLAATTCWQTRWATKVMPPILQIFMRHDSIETTLKYYVDQNADEAADVLWKAVTGNTSGNSAVEPSDTQKKSLPQAEPAEGLNE